MSGPRVLCLACGSPNVKYRPGIGSWTCDACLPAVLEAIAEMQKKEKEEDAAKERSKR